MRLPSLLAISVVAAYFVAGCTDIQSSDLKTAGMTAHMTVVSYGSGQTTVTASLNVDNNTTDFVALSSGDRLTATAGTMSQPLTEDDVLNDISYTTTFSSENASGTPYTIAFERVSDTSAPDNACTLPAPYMIAAPAAGATVSLASSIVVSYGGGGTNDSVSYSLSGPCIQGPSNVSLGGDPGMFTIASSSVVAGNAPSFPCQVTLSLARTRIGTVDPAFGGGDIACTQSRMVTFTLTQ